MCVYKKEKGWVIYIIACLYIRSEKLHDPLLTGLP